MICMFLLIFIFFFFHINFIINSTTKPEKTKINSYKPNLLKDLLSRKENSEIFLNRVWSRRPLLNVGLLLKRVEVGQHLWKVWMERTLSCWWGSGPVYWDFNRHFLSITLPFQLSPVLKRDEVGQHLWKVWMERSLSWVDGAADQFLGTSTNIFSLSRCPLSCVLQLFFCTRASQQIKL